MIKRLIPIIAKVIFPDPELRPAAIQANRKIISLVSFMAVLNLSTESDPTSPSESEILEPIASIIIHIMIGSMESE